VIVHDGDGIPDHMEDSDGDGVPDHLDNDDDGDGIPDDQEEAVAAAIKAGTMKDADGDGIPDHMEDSDNINDGSPDADGERPKFSVTALVSAVATFATLLIFAS